MIVRLTEAGEVRDAEWEDCVKGARHVESNEANTVWLWWCQGWWYTTDSMHQTPCDTTRYDNEADARSTYITLCIAAKLQGVQ